MAADPVFIDTNILVFATVAEAPLHVSARARLDALHDAGTPLWISRQVLREFLSTLSRPQTFSRPLPPSTLTGIVRLLERQFFVAEDNAEITRLLLNLLERIPAGGSQIHDANIVATMLMHGINRLLTHNPADFTRYAPEIELIVL